MTTKTQKIQKFEECIQNLQESFLNEYYEDLIIEYREKVWAKEDMEKWKTRLFRQWEIN